MIAIDVDMLKSLALELLLTVVVSFIFNILPNLLSGKKINFKNVLMTTLISSLISVIYKAFNFYALGVELTVNTWPTMIISPLVFSLIINLADLMKGGNLSFEKIVKEFSKKGNELSYLAPLSEIEM